MAFEEDIKFIEDLKKTINHLQIADIGCGPNKFPDAVGVDVIERPGIVDVVHNLDCFPWPLDDNLFDVVFCNHLIEHIDDIIKTMNEFHRILKTEGYLIIRTPHYSNVDSYTDPTHKRHLTTKSFDYFFIDNDKKGLYSKRLFTIEKVNLTFGGGLFSQLGKFLSKISLREYEKYWCRIFPANTIYFRFKALKNY